MAALSVEWLGRVGYADALELQAKAVEARQSGAAGDRLLLLEHPPVITLGRGSRTENVLCTADERAARGIELHEVARGGDVTYHAPGQLVGYPIVSLAERGERDVHAYLRRLEQALIDALAELGIEADRREGMTGVFTRSGRKIASIGVGVRRWVTCHGFALNVSLDLSGFETIVPCGLDGVEMTSVGRELAEAGSPRAADVLDPLARNAVSDAFGVIFG